MPTLADLQSLPNKLAGASVYTSWQLLALIRRRTRQRCLECGHITEGNLSETKLYLAWDTNSGKAPNRDNTRTFLQGEIRERFARLYQTSPAGADVYIPKLPIEIKDSYLDVQDCPECLPKTTPEPTNFITLHIPVLLSLPAAPKRAAESLPMIAARPVGDLKNKKSRRAKPKKKNAAPDASAPVKPVTNFLDLL